ncbi:thiamine pyrophosphate-dependent dehydrogenase E1 component subunit alpha [Kitasatospora sp. NA04385]|uniref:thiamine pyrophosphate-dependent dehydrogenase E1 component subunit alpha n=1 Tax=Kitasatospora sp. NA04385 TaxID=2742135 RepID=UPI00159276CB|nr:thiamine pyrophosphate-dependent dehydrogenase E1 component subunit alpha [Kitasatospora sp. NA04385]QKW22936.1 thiamine pyrophosphate-dependent dehydrogenase E1 component subunit alpha [Kitasatospora sp. NA04385]
MTDRTAGADRTTAPAPTADPAAALYRTVALVRGFEQRAVELVRAKVVLGGIHPYTGQEAIAAGTCAALRPDDVITSTHRGHGHVLAKGADPARTMAELAGRATGLNRGRGGSMHAADFGVGVLGANAVVGAAVPIAAGAAWAFRRAGSDRVALSYFGDGAVSQGVVLEAFNLAALWRVPLVLVCENNGFATSMRTEDTVAGSILGRAAAFGIPARTVDGTDPEAVRDATAEAVARARSGAGPTLLECTAYRFDAHHTWEHTARPRYRTDAEVAAGRARDPLEVQGARLPAATRAAIDAEVAQLLDRAVRFARESPHPDPAGALDHLYATGLRARAGAR